MQTNSVCKTLSVTLFVLDAIGTIILAFIYATAGWDFAFGTFLIVLICGIFFGLVSCVPLYALGEILESLALSNQYLYALSHATTASHHPATSATLATNAPDAPRPFTKPTDSSGWLCSCGQHNKQTATFCVACGKDR